MFRLKRIWLAATAATFVTACSDDAASASTNAAAAGNATTTANAQTTATAAAQALLPVEIVRWGEAKRRLCAEAGGRVTGAPAIHTSADFNGDGRLDHFVSAAGSFQCVGNELIYSDGPVGTSSSDLFLSTPRGYRLIEGAASDVEPIVIAQFEGKPVAMVTCGGPGAYERPCDTYAFGWNGREMTTVAYFINGRRVNEDGTRFDGGGWAASGFPAIPQGFYADDCHAAARDPDTPGFLYLTDRIWREWDAGVPITRIERNGPVRYRFHISTEDEEGNRSPSVIDIMTIHGDDFVVLNNGEGGDRNFSHCNNSEVPARIRREWTGR